jgi:ADP-heptose:LPS heptosyltransferase
MLQVATILPRLKEQGYHVTVMTTPKGKDIIAHDPNVDDWYIQDKDQVPNNELPYFWREQATRFDKFINLSESIEGTLLGIPGRPNHGWPHEVRHRRLNLNYFDWTAELAGVEFKPVKQFYPTDKEKQAADLLTSKAPFTVVWSLSGSSHHKFYPHMDAVIARIMLEWPDAQVIMVGDDACRFLEQGWDKEPRVVELSGEIAIRDTLALAQAADVVIGPETGVLNSVAHEPNAKIVMLSHSSKKNLTQHWYNTASLTPTGCACYPCHRLHYTREFCPGDTESMAAECMDKIEPAAVWEALAAIRKGKKK